MNILRIEFTDPSAEYYQSLKEIERTKVLARIEALFIGKYEDIRIKTPKGPIKELIVKDHRIIYVIPGGSLYLVSAFRKKSQKTPAHEIEMAEKKYLFLINN